MALNYFWVFFFLAGFAIGLVKLICFGDNTIFTQLYDSTVLASKDAFQLSIELTGLMTFWLGILKIGENSGLIRFFSRFVNPLFHRLFPEIPENHPAMGQITMNFSANMLGLGNAATPIGLKAMDSMQSLNPEKDTASNSQIMFLVLNTAGFTLLPVTIMMFRSEAKALNPSDIFIPILLSSFIATFLGITLTAIQQKIKLFDRVLIMWALGMITAVSLLVYYFQSLSKEQLVTVSNNISHVFLFSIISLFIAFGLIKKINVFESFIEGAKDGFTTVIKIIPYMVAMLVAIAVFRTSGGFSILLKGFTYIVPDPDLIKSLPTALMRPFSGSGARAMMIDTMHTEGPDSFAGRLSCIFQGASDTTFYIVALYFGSVGISKSRYAITFGLLTDFIGIIAAIFVAHLFF